MPFNTIRTRPSLDRPSVALRLGSSAHPNSCLRNTGNTANQYCKPRILSQLLATNASSCTTIVQLMVVSRLLPLTWRADSPATGRTPETSVSCLRPRQHPARCLCPRPLPMQGETCPATWASRPRLRGDGQQTDFCPEQ
ncbi:hypothetical protein T01_1894 [Trichinella spiralis]|uniref:Uncharacterized protein n=1 Tax=Trichinella spiralis TaxID=6334 RepID=A0A0V1AM37_TRISP|nr:hypothetical protein T01_1894 [Trichinella spiralis]